MLGLTWPSQALADPAAPPTPPQVMSHAPGERIPIPRLSGPIQLDGVIDEPAWEAVAPVAFTTHWPEFGKTPDLSKPIEVTSVLGGLHVDYRRAA
jgi:hypothetical protein